MRSITTVMRRCYRLISFNETRRMIIVMMMMLVCKVVEHCMYVCRGAWWCNLAERRGDDGACLSFGLAVKMDRSMMMSSWAACMDCICSSKSLWKDDDDGMRRGSRGRGGEEQRCTWCMWGMKKRKRRWIDRSIFVHPIIPFTPFYHTQIKPRLKQAAASGRWRMIQC